MDYSSPSPPIPFKNPLLSESPILSQIDLIARGTIGTIVGYTISSPLMRLATLRMAQRSHRRNGDFVPKPSGPFLPFEKLFSTFKSIRSHEKIRGYYRGMAPLVVMSPLRAMYHISVYDLIEQNRLASTASTSTKDKSKTQRLDQTKDIGNLLEKDNHRMPSWQYFGSIFGLMLTCETILYPSHYLYIKLAGDLLGSNSTIQTNSSFRLLTQTIRQESIKGLYKGFSIGFIRSLIVSMVYAADAYYSSKESKQFPFLFATVFLYPFMNVNVQAIMEQGPGKRPYHFLHSYNRLVGYGSKGLFAGFLTVMAANLLFGFTSGITAHLAVFPHLIYTNKVEYGVWSIEELNSISTREVLLQADMDRAIGNQQLNKKKNSNEGEQHAATIQQKLQQLEKEFSAAETSKEAIKQQKKMKPLKPIVEENIVSDEFVQEFERQEIRPSKRAARIQQQLVLETKKTESETQSNTQQENFVWESIDRRESSQTPLLSKRKRWYSEYNNKDNQPGLKVKTD